MKANPENAIWLYFQIEQDLASLIDGGTLAPGSQLPLEEELVQRYGNGYQRRRIFRVGLPDVRRGRHARRRDGDGGGNFVVPELTLISFGIEMPHAVGASLVSVITASCGSAASAMENRLTNVRLVIPLEISRCSGHSRA
jgi:hypothetical protein